MIADQAQPSFGVEALAVEGDDARRFLAAMLERMQAKRGQRRRIRMSEYAEHAALLAQQIAIEIEIAVIVRMACMRSSQFGIGLAAEGRLLVRSSPCLLLLLLTRPWISWSRLWELVFLVAFCLGRRRLASRWLRPGWPSPCRFARSDPEPTLVAFVINSAISGGITDMIISATDWMIGSELRVLDPRHPAGRVARDSHRSDRR